MKMLKKTNCPGWFTIKWWFFIGTHTYQDWWSHSTEFRENKSIVQSQEGLVKIMPLRQTIFAGDLGIVIYESICTKNDSNINCITKSLIYLIKPVVCCCNRRQSNGLKTNKDNQDPNHVLSVQNKVNHKLYLVLFVPLICSWINNIKCKQAIHREHRQAFNQYYRPVLVSK